MPTGSDPPPDQCRANLTLQIQQTEEFVAIEVDQIEEQLVALKRDCAEIKRTCNLGASLVPLKYDSNTMKNYFLL